MDITQLAEQLNNCEYRSEVSDEIAKIAKEHNLVIVFGYSDDNMEFRGAIYDEIGCWGGGKAFLNEKGIITRRSFNGFGQ
jgi:hypothetical protein